MTEIETLQWLQDIIKWADENKISYEEIPRDKEKLKNIKSIRITSLDKNVELPNEFQYLENLEKLDMSLCIGHDQIPSCVLYLKQLKYFIFSSNNMAPLSDPDDEKTDIAPILQLSNLKHLDFSFNLSKLPDDIDKLQNLESLKLRNSILFVDTITKNIANLPHLQYLDLSLNCIKTLPAEIINLTNLKKINLSRNDLTLSDTQIVWLKDLRKNNCRVIVDEEIEVKMKEI